MLSMESSFYFHSLLLALWKCNNNLVEVHFNSLIEDEETQKEVRFETGLTVFHLIGWACEKYEFEYTYKMYLKFKSALNNIA